MELNRQDVKDGTIQLVLFVVEFLWGFLPPVEKFLFFVMSKMCLILCLTSSCCCSHVLMSVTQLLCLSASSCMQQCFCLIPACQLKTVQSSAAVSLLYAVNVGVLHWFCVNVFNHKYILEISSEISNKCDFIIEKFIRDQASENGVQSFVPMLCKAVVPNVNVPALNVSTCVWLYNIPSAVSDLCTRLFGAVLVLWDAHRLPRGDLVAQISRDRSLFFYLNINVIYIGVHCDHVLVQINTFSNKLINQHLGKILYDTVEY